jgi:hypothetical protein
MGTSAPNGPCSRVGVLPFFFWRRLLRRPPASRGSYRGRSRGGCWASRSGSVEVMLAALLPLVGVGLRFESDLVLWRLRLRLRLRLLLHLYLYLLALALHRPARLSQAAGGW